MITFKLHREEVVGGQYFFYILHFLTKKITINTCPLTINEKELCVGFILFYFLFNRKNVTSMVQKVFELNVKNCTGCITYNSTHSIYSASLPYSMCTKPNKSIFTPYMFIVVVVPYIYGTHCAIWLIIYPCAQLQQVIYLNKIYVSISFPLTRNNSLKQ